MKSSKSGKTSKIALVVLLVALALFGVWTANVLKKQKGQAFLKSVLMVDGRPATTTFITGETSYLPKECPWKADEAEGKYVINFQNDKAIGGGTGSQRKIISSAYYSNSANKDQAHFVMLNGLNVADGKYKVWGYGFDGYQGRKNVTQPEEQFQIVLRSSGQTLASSDYIKDIPDYVEAGEQINELGTVTINKSANEVVALHKIPFDQIKAGFSQPNSVMPVCAYLEKVLVCGDGKKEGTEQCDSGSNNGKVCEAEYGKSCDYCSTDCEIKTVKGPFCGDKKKNGQEQCDGADGVGEGQECSGECRLMNKSGKIYLIKTASPESVEVGQEVTYSYQITNTGEAVLSNITLSDNKLGAVSCPKNILAVKESMVCEKKAKISENTTNVAVVRGRTPTGEEVNSEDDATVKTLGKNITLEKTVSPTLVKAGEEVTYTYKITNTGQVNLVEVQVEDDKLGWICSGLKLSPGQSTTCTKKARINNDTKNVATVFAKTESGQKVSYQDDATVSTKSKPKEDDDDDCSGSIGNYIWNDKDGDGVQDANESGISGVKVCALNGNDKDCDKTNAQGEYEIKDLCSGEYDVVVNGEDVAGLVLTYDPDGKKNNKTKIELKGNNDESTKADWGYRFLAPATGVGMNIAMVLGAAILITVVVVGVLLKMKKI